MRPDYYELNKHTDEDRRELEAWNRYIRSVDKLDREAQTRSRILTATIAIVVAIIIAIIIVGIVANS